MYSQSDNEHSESGNAYSQSDYGQGEAGEKGEDEDFKNYKKLDLKENSK